MKKMNNIIYGAGEFECKRNKYERQKRFKIRANEEYRKFIRSLYQADLKKTEHNMEILSFPIFDFEGNTLLDYQSNIKRIKKEGIKSKYIRLKLRFEK